MEFIVNQAELFAALVVASKALDKNTDTLVLSGVRVIVRDGSVTLIAADLTKSIKYTLPNAAVIEDGDIVIPGTLLLNIVKKLPNKDVSIRATPEDKAAVISCDAVTFDIKTLDARDFPDIPTLEPTQEITLPYEMFSSMAKQTVVAAGKDDSRPILTGVLIEVGDGVVKMVATDSYRLAVATADLPDYQGDAFSAVISGEFIKELCALPKSDENMHIGLTDNQVVVNYLGTTLINRRIMGNYPNYKQLLSSDFETEFTIGKNEFSDALSRVDIVSNTGMPIRLAIDADGKLLQVSSLGQDKGSAMQNIACEIEGTNMSVGYSCKYLQDGLSAIPSDTVRVCIKSPERPGVMYATGKEDFLYLLMPMRL